MEDEVTAHEVENQPVPAKRAVSDSAYYETGIPGRLPRVPASVPIERLQCARTVLMVPPTYFERPDLAHVDEVKEFEHDRERLSDREIRERVNKEYAGFVTALRKAGVEVIEHRNPDPEATSALFPNNVFSTHDSSDIGTPCFVTYPMYQESRRRERHPALLDHLHSLGFPIHIDLSAYEQHESPLTLEGTGALVLDRVHKVAFANLSHRSTETVAINWARRFGYQLIMFQSKAHERSIYHTNVLMSIGPTLAVACYEVIDSVRDRDLVRTALERYHEVLEINTHQLHRFCGNVLQLRRASGGTVLAMSTRAWEAFTEPQRAVLRRHCDEIVHAPLTVIEDEAGGSARCLLAEIFNDNESVLRAANQATSQGG